MKFIEKELSWLSFNHRVLQEAQDISVPLLERLRFLGIYSSNMDEFYRVRVANVRRKIYIAKSVSEKKQARELYDLIQQKVIELQLIFDDTYLTLLNKLSEQDINLINEMQLSQEEEAWLDTYYKDKLRRHIFPLILTENINLKDNIKDDSTYLMVAMTINNHSQYALIEVPSSNVPRFVKLPKYTNSDDESSSIILLDNIIRHSLKQIFVDFFEFDYIHAYSMKLTRDAEFDLSNEFSQSLFEQMNTSLRKRINAEPVRLVYDKKMPADMLSVLKQKLNITSNQRLVSGGRYHSFKDFIEFPDVGNKSLSYEKMSAIEHKDFRNHPNAFTAMANKDILLYYPYHKFSHFTEWLRQAAYDPKVVSIEISLYRVAKKSRVVAALIEAVKNGKQTTVNIELRARFDEQANLNWAEILTNAGAKVTFGIPNLKVHAKICLITRKEESGLVRYAHIGSGNFHEKNAKIYTDFSLFTCRPELTEEVAQVFKFIKSPYQKFTFEHLIISPINSRASFVDLIDQEISAAKNNHKSGITLKVNNLVDHSLINKLYQASNAGVPIKLIIRGICTLVAGIKEQSENIQVISIIDRFLEHPRVAIFEQKGNQKVLLSSADWMNRNIEERVEVTCPIYCHDVKKQIIDIINIQLADNTKARIIDSEQRNLYPPNHCNEKVRSQMAIYRYLTKQNDELVKTTELTETIEQSKDMSIMDNFILKKEPA
ncbi:polyphosphate kinase 1 [Colwellia sp. 4_MG-2023]|jgi:polyphosphate kinase|uniref:polyphosphate kinase 1 n=1 Tax=unclassified Colwellia TaxID=196834 RepID=UPI001C09CEEB|nr:MULTISPECIES: polyphosphate kinase 1 [unclassified Colwellia]MBU2926526.1 polyphosphate kinase 1 [Colwellia sp. C2M11]MDO6507605.1 polyphosphate kinase 1 [Colwellia sp. 5_MG-2023]MDO6556440.1 polyphosphate kinase 1 [Colwellia sp. 4_MG-2023]MDO6652564.1 polyphosphate kinase 1 [Colwellia sp. 3_MG-2023]MDO6665165.1 polyphosphate kinase 1 [Colwellia sp. 2_MG-2023]